MIFDQSAHANWYRTIHPRLAQAFDFLAQNAGTELPIGKHFIEGEFLFAMANAYSTQPVEKCRFEAHRRYTDIQWMVSGQEQIGVTNVANLSVAEPHIEEQDIAFFHPRQDLITTLTLIPGTFAIFFPHDAHCPGIALAEPQLVRKIVMKVDLS